jgi:N-acetylmuramoyl-L-alanine amidase
MDFNRVAKAEADFKATGNALGKKYILSPFSIAIPGDDHHKLEGVTCRPENGFTGYFYQEKHDKKKVVLHFTVGHLKGDILSLTSESRGHVSTAFVLGRDGTIYQLFSSAAWSYHLGRNALGGNGNQSKLSIGIEISNYGPLIKKGNNLETVYSKADRKDVYCTMDDTEQYIKLDKAFRGYRYYTAFTNEQYHNLILLLRYLTASYKIPRTFPNENELFETTRSSSADLEGIMSHVNFRTDKIDIGPAFDWERVMSGVQAEVYGGNPLEDLVKRREKDVVEAKTVVEKAQVGLQTAETALAEAKEQLEMSEVGSRSVVMRSEGEIDESFPTSRETPKEYGEDGPEPFDIDKSPFYTE